MGCTGIKTLEIRSGIEAIPEAAFSGCTGITEVTFPKSVISIGDSAFTGCTALANVSIPKNTLSIGSSAFAGAVFKEVTVNSKCSYQTNSFPEGTKIENY